MYSLLSLELLKLATLFSDFLESLEVFPAVFFAVFGFLTITCRMGAPVAIYSAHFFLEISRS